MAVAEPADYCCGSSGSYPVGMTPPGRRRAYPSTMTVPSVARWRDRVPAPASDALLAGFVTVIVLLGSYGESYPSQPSDRIGLPSPLPHVPLAEFAVVLVSGAALAWRRRFPVAVWAVSLAAALAYTALGRVNGAVVISPIVALYTVVTARRRAGDAVVFGIVTAATIFVVGGLLGPFGWAGGGQEVIPFVVAATVFLGLAVANRRSLLQELSDRAERAERSRDAEARRRVDAERLRIARELHDVVAHTMATITVQAAAAAHVLDSDPDTARQGLQSIRAASKGGLRELRAILDVLRQVGDAEPLTPAPGLVDLPALAAGCTAAGLPTSVEVRGAPNPLPPAVDLAAYRIVQESLTNAVRHAGPATAQVVLSYGPDALDIDVSDTGRPGPPAPEHQPGHGLAGMAERASSVGGTLTAGRREPHGFGVHARLPIEHRREPTPAGRVGR